jgi:hydrogenase maturation protease
MKLLIGYGNTLRNDDGVGQKVATIVEQWKIPGVRSHCVHQLTPELVTDIAQAELVIFVDAAIQQEVEVRKLVSSSEASDNLGHSLNPETLLSLTEILYNHLPDAYWILIPGINFDFGEDFSPLTQEGMEKALEEIKQLLLIFS